MCSTPASLAASVTLVLWGQLDIRAALAQGEETRNPCESHDCVEDGGSRVHIGLVKWSAWHLDKGC